MLIRNLSVKVRNAYKKVNPLPGGKLWRWRKRKNEKTGGDPLDYRFTV